MIQKLIPGRPKKRNINLMAQISKFI